MFSAKNTNKMTKVRINKFLSEAGYCSRREADKLLERNEITVNGKSAELGQKIDKDDLIKVNGKAINKPKEKFIYIAFNKPVGIVCTTDTKKEKNNIIDYINHSKRIFPIGRLDKASEGLILLTNDGDIVNKILRAGNNHEKEYYVTVNKAINDEFCKKMSSGIPILGTITKKCFVKQINRNIFKIILTEGLNRQIRRMCEYLGYEVVALKRTRIMNIKLDLPLGKYRNLSKKEFNTLNYLLKDSAKIDI